MPHTESAKKRLRQSKVRRLRNRAVLSDLKTAVKRYLKALKEKDLEGAKTALVAVYKRLDKASARRYIHPNTGDRYKSRLTKRLATLTSAAT